MKILICGIDGYIGFPLTVRLVNLGHDVVGIDNFLRRTMVDERKSCSATPISSIDKRLDKITELFHKSVEFHSGDMTDFDFVFKTLRSVRPDVVVNLAHQPSAAYSMASVNHADFTYFNNVSGTLNLVWSVKRLKPHPHIISIGTLGEYGQPNMPIPE